MGDLLGAPRGGRRPAQPTPATDHHLRRVEAVTPTRETIGRRRRQDPAPRPLRAEAVSLTRDTFGWRPGSLDPPAEPPTRRASTDSSPGRRRAPTDTSPGRRRTTIDDAAGTPSGRRGAASDDATGPPPGRRRAATPLPPYRRAPGRRRAAEENPWAVAADAAQAARRAAVDLTRRALPVAQPKPTPRPLSIVVRPEPDTYDARYSDTYPIRRAAGAAARDSAAVARDRTRTGRNGTDGDVTGPATAGRILGTFREWTSADEHAPPVTGNHRAPGTWAIETWLLIGRGRQQALLAAMVAVGILLVMIPVQQRQAAVDTAAGSRAISVGQKGRASKAPATSAPAGPGKTTPRPAKPAPGPSTGPSAQPAPGGEPADQPPPVPEPSASVSPSSSAEASADGAFGPSNSRRLTGSDTVALTFDDGPDPVQTPRLLALLAQYRVTATFCLVGRQVKAHPDIVRQIAAAGHALCNHSWDHSFTLGKESPKDIRADLKATSAAIREAVPDAEIPYFRAPGGFFTDRLVSAAGDYGMISIYWQVDPKDWERQGGETDAEHVDRVVDTVKSELRPGGIVLSHDFNQPGTIAAYERLLPYIAGSFKTGLP